MAKAKLLDSWIPDWPSTSNHSNRSKEYKLSVVTLEQEDGQESIQHLFVLAGQVWPSGRHIVNPKWANYRPLQLLDSRGDQYIPPCLSTRLCPPQAGLTHKSHLDKTADGQANFLFLERKKDIHARRDGTRAAGHKTKGGCRLLTQWQPGYNQPAKADGRDSNHLDDAVPSSYLPVQSEQSRKRSGCDSFEDSRLRFIHHWTC